MLNENAAPADPDVPHLERLVIVRASNIKRTHSDDVGELAVTKLPAGRPVLHEVPPGDRAEFAQEDDKWQPPETQPQ
ncbi:hypothetical protein CCE01nite_41970 [Cellulomonas cellasea]|nr:hypothetical protein CCE01nite_41970 [Cellulomonas cellasea]